MNYQDQKPQSNEERGRISGGQHCGGTRGEGWISGGQHSVVEYEEGTHTVYTHGAVHSAQYTGVHCGDVISSAMRCAVLM